MTNQGKPTISCTADHPKDWPCPICTPTPTPAPAAAEFALVEMREALMKAKAAYDKEYWMRTADVHKTDCDCLRCAMDGVSAALAGRAP